MAPGKKDRDPNPSRRGASVRAGTGSLPKAPPRTGARAPVAADRRLSETLQETHTQGLLSPAPYRPLPLETQTLYAELLEQLRGAEFARSFADLAGGLTTRERGGEKYWYFRSSEGLGAAREFYIGPDNEATQQLLQAYRERQGQAQGNTERRRRLAAMLRSGGLTLTDPTSSKIIQAFTNAGVFQLGGVLVGTHAFLALGNALGVKWTTALQTQDVDFGALATHRVGIGVRQTPLLMAHVPSAIDALKMGFVPSIRLHASSKPTTYVVPGKDWRIDLVTSPRGKDRDRAVPIPRLGAHAQPLEFMDYLLEKTMDAALVGKSGILVAVPEPARFALHKLLVAGNREPRAATKAPKDRQQAFCVLSFLAQERPGDIRLAGEDALQRGPRWRQLLREQAQLLPGKIAELENLLRGTGG